VRNGDVVLDVDVVWDEDAQEMHGLLGMPAEMGASLAGGLKLAHLVKMLESVEQLWELER